MNVVWAWCVARIPADGLEEWIRQMDAPLDPKAPPTAEQEAREGEDFMSAMATLTGGMG